MSDTTNLVEYSVTNRIATITLNRPEKLNAFSDELVMALGDALRRFDTDPEAWTAIIHGKGRAFSTGADVLQRQLRSREEFERLGGPQAHGAHASDLLINAVNWKPVIAAAHGHVMGLAFGIMLACDLVVAEEGTKIQLTETSRGLGGAQYWAMMQFRNGGAFATEMANKVASDALQVLGAQGYMKDHPLERHYRDARQLMIVEGSSQVQRVVISRSMIDRNLVYG